jgi:DNA-binding transcriptional ArsR family regulator
MSEHLAPELMRQWLDFWTRPDEFGTAYIDGITEFYENFFREEERRISSDLERALEHGRQLAARLSPLELFEELSRGIRDTSLAAQKTLILVPCYWCSPRVIPAMLDEDTQIVLFGARPADASLIPGDTVPAALLLSLEALSDPTRLTIVRSLAEKPMTQAELARKLRLRPPTISHHLKTLRIAELIAFIETDKDETRYEARISRLDDVCAALKQFFNIAKG